MAKLWPLDGSLIFVFFFKNFNISSSGTLISNVQARAGTPKHFLGKTTLKVLQKK